MIHRLLKRTGKVSKRTAYLIPTVLEGDPKLVSLIGPHYACQLLLQADSKDSTWMKGPASLLPSSTASVLERFSLYFLFGCKFFCMRHSLHVVCASACAKGDGA